MIGSPELKLPVSKVYRGLGEHHSVCFKGSAQAQEPHLLTSIFFLSSSDITPAYQDGNPSAQSRLSYAGQHPLCPRR